MPLFYLTTSATGSSGDSGSATSILSAYHVSGSDVSAFHIVRLTGDSVVAHALASDSATSLGVVGVAQTATTGSLTGTLVKSHGQKTRVKFDTSGSKANPAPGGVAYLSTDFAGQAQASIPVQSGSNQRLRLGLIVGVDSQDVTFADILWQAEMWPITADGTA